MKNFSKGKTSSTQLYYKDEDGNIVPVTPNTQLPINLKNGVGAVLSPWKLNYEDIVTNASKEEPKYWPYVAVIIPEEDKLYDNKLITHTYMEFAEIGIPSPINYDIYLNVPQYVTGIIMLNRDTYGLAKYGNLHLIVYYEDGTYEQIEPTIISSSARYEFDTLLYAVNSTKKVVKLRLLSSQYDEISGTYVGVTQKFDCYGLYVYVNPHKTQIDMSSSVQSIDSKVDVNLSQAGQQYLYNATDAKSVYDRLVDILNKLDLPISQAAQQYLYNSTDAKSVYDRLVDILNKYDVLLSQAGKEYLFDSVNNKSAISALEDINNTLQEYVINEVSLPIITQSASPALSIAATAKPTAPQETQTITFPATDSQGNTLYGSSAVIQIRKFSGYIELSFSNSDTAAAHTAYVEVDIDGVQAASGNISVPAATTTGPGSATLVLSLEQIDPADETLNIDIYVWADTASVVTLNTYSLTFAVGTNSTSYDNIISINRDGLQVIAASFTNNDTNTYSWLVSSQLSNVRINELQSNDIYLSDLLPKVNINLEIIAASSTSVTNSSIAYITGIYVGKKLS